MSIQSFSSFRELFLSQKIVTHDDMAINHGPRLEELRECQSYSDSETELLASNKRKKFNFRSGLMSFVRPKSRDQSQAEATKKRHKTLPAEALHGIREVISKSGASKRLTSTGNSREQASSAKDGRSRAREDLEQAGSSKLRGPEVIITEPGIAATPTDSEGNKTTDAEIEGGNFTTTTDEGTAHLEPTTANCGNGPQPIVTGERRMNSATKVSTDNVATSTGVEEGQLIGKPAAVCSSVAEDVGLPQAGASDVKISSNNEGGDVDLGMAQACPSDHKMTGQSPRAVRVRCTSSECILEPAVANQDP